MLLGHEHKRYGLPVLEDNPSALVKRHEILKTSKRNECLKFMMMTCYDEDMAYVSCLRMQCLCIGTHDLVVIVNMIHDSMLM